MPASVPRLRLLAFALLLPGLLGQGSRPQFNYQFGGCESELLFSPPSRLLSCATAMTPPRSSPPTLELETAPGYFRFRYRFEYTCCADWVIPEVWRPGNVVAIAPQNFGNSCRCVCEYELEGRLENLPPGSYRLQFYAPQESEETDAPVLLWERLVEVEGS